MLLSPLAPPGAPDPESLIKLYTEKKMQTYAMVQGGTVINVVVWDGATPYAPPEGCALHACDGPVGIGWAWVDGAPVDPNPPPLPAPARIVDPEKPAEGGPAVL